MPPSPVPHTTTATIAFASSLFLQVYARPHRSSKAESLGLLALHVTPNQQCARTEGTVGLPQTACKFNI